MGAEWQIQELERGVKPSTVNRNLNSLRGVLTLAIERGVLELHPFSRLKNVKECDEQSTRYLSSEELARLFNTLDARQTRMIEERRSANLWRRQRRRPELPDIPDAAFADHLYPLIVVALNTGMRKGELFALTWTDIDMEAGYITVRASVAKSGRVRRIPMNASVMAALDRWRSSPCGSRAGLVFPGKSGKPLRDVKKAWGALLQAASIFDFRFHDMRHHFASQLTIKGAHPSVVQKLLGHADIETTMRYAHLGPNQMTDAVNLLVD